MLEKYRPVSHPFLSVIFWLMLNLADACITIAALELGLQEGNPIMAGFAGPELVMVKFALSVVVLYGLYRFHKMKLLVPLNVGMGVIVAWNIIAMTLGAV